MGRNAGTLSEILTNIVELKDCFLTMRNDFPQSSLMLRQLYHFATDFDRVLLELMDILNILFKHRVGYRQLIFITETFILLMNGCAKFNLLIVNLQ